MPKKRKVSNSKPPIGPTKAPFGDDLPSAVSLPGLDTVEQLMALEKYLKDQRAKLIERGIVPPGVEAYPAEGIIKVLELGRKIVEIYEEHIGKITFNISIDIPKK